MDAIISCQKDCSVISDQSEFTKRDAEKLINIIGKKRYGEMKKIVGIVNSSRNDVHHR